MRGPGTSPSSIARLSAKPAVPGEPEIADGGEAGAQRGQRIVGADQSEIVVGLDRFLPERVAGHAHQVDVGVDQAGQDGAAGKVDQARARGRRRQAGRDAR